MADLNRALATAVKTGKVSFGTNTSMNSAIAGKARLIIVASNCPNKTREKLERYCKMSEIPLIRFSQSALDLGRVCGKPFSISALSIRDPGDSDIFTIVEEKNV